MSPQPNFRELQDRIVEMRRQRRFSEEAALLAEALDRQPTPKLEMLLSRALMRAHDCSGSLAAARSALSDEPGLEASFASHLKEIGALERLIDEIDELTRRRARARPASGAVAYCLQNALPYRQGGYAIRSHALAREVIGGRELSAFVRPGFPSDTGGGQPSPEGEQTVEGVPYIFTNDLEAIGNSFAYLVEAADSFENSFRNRSVGLVHAATSFWTALPAAIAAHRLGLPFVYEVRSFWEITRDAREPGFAASAQARRDRLLEAITLALADRVVTLNAPMRDHLAEAGVDAGRITIIPNCVDGDRFGDAQRDRELARRYGGSDTDIVIGYMGAMLAYEGLDLLVEAATALAARNPDVRLLIVGAAPEATMREGTVEHGLARQIAAAGMEGRIRLAGRVPPGEAPGHYGLFDICAYPRRAYEVCELVSPLKPLEAMAAGKAVVVSDVGGMRDLVAHGETGLVCAAGDAESLAAALAELLGNRDLRTRLGRNARRFVNDSRDWKDAAASLDALYDSLAGGEGIRTSDELADDVAPLLSALVGAESKRPPKLPQGLAAR